MTSYELTHFKKMVRVWQTKSPLFCLRYDPLIVFRRQNHVTFVFIKTISHDLLVQMAYCILIRRSADYTHPRRPSWVRKKAAKVFKNSWESPWYATLKESFHDLFECLCLWLKKKTNLVANKRPVSIALLPWSSITKKFTRNLNCSPHMFGSRRSAF